MKKTKYLSLDASSKATGFAIFEDKTLQSSGCLTASSTDPIKRINKIITALDEILKKENIDIIIMEEVIPTQGKNLQTYRVLMWLQAAINFLIHENYSRVKIEYLYPSEWRKTCGIKMGGGVRRETLKQEDINFVEKTFNIKVSGDDEADAIGIGIAYIKELTKVKNEINWE